MKIAYFINTYPIPSIAWIRTEIDTLEQLGVTVLRFTARRFHQPLVDPNDLAEEARTRAVLGVGPLALILHLLRDACTRPRRFLHALRYVFRLGRAGERGILHHLVYLAEACVLRRWLERDQVDHLHTHFATNSAAVALLCRVLGGPTYSFTMHGPEEFDSPRGWSLRDKIHLAQFVVAVSEFTRSQLLRWSNYQDWSKIHVVRLGVSPLFLEHGPAPIPDSNRFVNIGRVVEQKGHAILIQAVARLRDQGIPCQLTIVGDGNMRPEIERLIRHFQLEDSVRITGFLSNQDVRNQLLAARALVLPSFAEGLPVVMFEALALGRPVITTYIAGHPELIENGVNGWLVPAGAVDPLVHAMAQALAAEPATLELMGRAGAASVAERHNPAIEVPKLLNLFTSRGQSTLPSQAIPLPRTIEPSQSAAPELRPKMASR